MYDLLKAFCQPYLPLMLVVGASVFAARRRNRMGGGTFRLILATWAALVLLSVPLTGHLLMGTLEWRWLPLPAIPERPEAIVVLGGGLIPETDMFPEAAPNGSSYTRVLHAWRLYRRTGGCPMILCGGPTAYGDSRSTEAGVMADLLVRLGVPETDIITEGRSTSTFENAVLAAEILRTNGWTRPVLVTEAHHMPRARRCFEKQAIHPAPAPCGFQSERLDGPPHEWIIPNAKTLDRCQSVLTEWVGLGYYRLRGRI